MTGDLGDALVEYVSAFAGFGLLALLVFHPSVAPTLLNGVQSIFTRVTNIGSNAGAGGVSTLPSSPASQQGSIIA